MSVVIIRQDGKINAWKEALQAKAPQVNFYSYLEDHPKDEIEVAMVWKHPPGIFAEYTQLKYIASFGAGVDFIFDDSQLPDKIPVTRVVDQVLASDMSEFVIGIILTFLKNLHLYRTEQNQKIWNPRPYSRISDVTIGIMGLGALGLKLFEDLKALKFRILGWSNSIKSVDRLVSYIGDEQKSEFLSKVDILVCLLPLTDRTRGILNKGLFKKLPKGAYIINVARGGHLVDQDLIEMLDIGQLSGACLDVYHKEPLPENHPFWDHPKIFMTPHIASVSDVDAVVPQLLENYFRFKQGLPLRNLVSTTRGY